MGLSLDYLVTANTVVSIKYCNVYMMKIVTFCIQNTVAL